MLQRFRPRWPSRNNARTGLLPAVSLRARGCAQRGSYGHSTFAHIPALALAGTAQLGDRQSFVELLIASSTLLRRV